MAPIFSIWLMCWLQQILSQGKPCFKARLFLLVVLLFFRFRVGGGVKKKALKMTSQQVIFRGFFYINRTNSKTRKVNQQSVLNL